MHGDARDPNSRRAPRRAGGFTLIEVLIALLILSVGLLGAAFLQTASLRSLRDSSLYTLAIFQAQDMAERMLANAAGVAAGAYDSSAQAPAGPDCATPADAPPCTPEEMARYDIRAWNGRNGALLPAGQGRIDRVGGDYVISVQWGAPGAEQSHALHLRP